ncbi:hypothetical protein DE146DRAFT_681396 [Phaeosphaeria sp. MPI-PUGE-AT-0046c]|nr:hypothetical protein DE146DRAFT_681396 [Phaeosphaeria sp. MPI-PUGE-AT-0046c]
MGVCTAEPNMCNLVNRVKPRKVSKRYRTPNCTHLDMDRVFGRHQQCDVCGRPPSIGFLYECRQDWETQSLHDALAEDMDEGKEVVKSGVRLQLESLGFSESIICAAEQGHYTDVQLEKIIEQKKDLRQIISDSLQASQINSAAAKLAAMAHAPSNNDGACDSILGKAATDIDVIYAQRHPRKHFYKQGHRSSGDIARALSRRRSTFLRPGLRSALQGIFRPRRASSSAGSDISLPVVPRTGTARNSSEVEDVEDCPALRKVQRDQELGELQAGAPGTGSEDIVSRGNYHDSSSQDSGFGCQDNGVQDTSTSSFNSSTYSDASDGSEVDVEVGTALSGEAVEMHDRGDLGLGISPLKGAAVVQDVEMDEDEDADDEADIGLQSIMTQV